MRELHLEYAGEPCELCTERPGQALHHRKRRSQGGDDTRENLAWLCHQCHELLHRHGLRVT